MDYKYLVFCPSCGFPTEITKFILRQYIVNHGVKVIYCHHCHIEMKIPDYIKKIANDLT